MSFMKSSDYNKNLGSGLSSTYIGIVEDNNDPENRQRVKARIPELYGNLETSKLPWCVRSESAGNTNSDGSYNVPSKGQLIEIEFDEGCVYSPKYNNGFLRTSVSEFNVGDYGYKDSFGNLVKITNQGIYVKDKNNNEVTTSSSGINAKDLNNNVINTTSGQILVQSSTIKLDGDVEITKTLKTTGAATFSSTIDATGKITSSDDCISSSISGKSHTHTFTQAPSGQGTTNPPQ